MSDYDVPIDEMRRLSNIGDKEIERLFAGQAPDGDTDLGEVARFFKDLHEAYPEASTDVHEETHVAAMIEAAHLLAENGEPAARSASKAHGPETQVSGLPKWRRKVIMLQGLFASTRVKIISIALALLMAFGGTAFAGARGALPRPIQSAVAGAARAVGIDLPDPEVSEVDADQNDQGDIDEGSINDADDVDEIKVDEGRINDADDVDEIKVDEDADDNDQTEVDEDADDNDQTEVDEDTDGGDSGEVDEDTNGSGQTEVDHGNDNDERDAGEGNSGGVNGQD